MADIVEYPHGTTFPGKIGRTVSQSSPAWPAPTRAREGAPNVLFFVLDDAGFAQLGCYGGLVNTPNLDPPLTQMRVFCFSVHAAFKVGPS